MPNRNRSKRANEHEAPAVHPTRASWHRLRYAYHEAGHAVLGHWFGRCIGVVSVLPHEEDAELFDEGLRGHCLFDIFAEAEHAVPDWQPGHRNPTLLAILYAGVYAGVNACDEHGWQLLRWNLGYGQDLAEIERFLDRLELSSTARAALKAEQEQLALDLVLAFWPVIADLAWVLAKRGKLPGHEAHRLIQQGLNPNYSDWRMEPHS